MFLTLQLDGRPRRRCVFVINYVTSTFNFIDVSAINILTLSVEVDDLKVRTLSELYRLR